MDDPTEYSLVYDNVFIGSVDAVYDREFTNNMNIGLIVKCESETGIMRDDIDTFYITDFLDGPINMEYDAEITASLEKVIDSIHTFMKNKRGKSILIHCFAGQNRSALVVGMYLRKYYSLTYVDIIGFLTMANARRGCPVLWNKDFQRILRLYEPNM